MEVGRREECRSPCTKESWLYYDPRAVQANEDKLVWFEKEGCGKVLDSCGRCYRGLCTTKVSQASVATTVNLVEKEGTVSRA